MKVNISYHDNESLTVEEIVKYAVSNYGKAARVEITPESGLAYDYIYHGLRQLITQEQVSLFYDTDSYQIDIKKLRADVLYKVTEILDSVIIDNEGRLTGI